MIESNRICMLFSMVENLLDSTLESITKPYFRVVLFFI